MDVDYIVIGAGISSAAVGFELASHGNTLIVDMESTGDFHSTGRSAALYTPNYGPSLVRKINKLSYPFLSAPPAGFTKAPLLSSRGMMQVIPNEFEHRLDAAMNDSGQQVQLIDPNKAVQLAPFLRIDNIHAAIYEETVCDMDVNALHQGFLNGFKRTGGQVLYNALVTAIDPGKQGWILTINGTLYTTRTLINAAGAWADEVGAMAKATPIGLQPKRRTAILIDAPANTSLAKVPAMDFAGVANYIKPEAQQLMASPGDATPVPAQDIQTDDLDVAKLVDWIERTTLINVNRVNHQWAGLRSFTPSGTPVVGFDPNIEGFFWLAGQGGYGIMMASALARACAALITNDALPQDFIEAGITPSALNRR